MNQITELLRNLGPVRVAALAATAIAVVGFMIFLVTRLSGGGMELLYGSLDPADQGQVVRHLDSLGVKYQVKGNQVLVPQADVLRARVSLADQGLPGSGSVGYEIFDKSQGIGTTNFVQNVNLVRALEGELARTIGSIQNVRQARVHLVLPRRELFSRERQKPSASVVLRMQGGNRLDKQRVQAIQYLVAAAVPELAPDRVSIIDDRGNLLARGNGADPQALAISNSEELRVSFEQRTGLAVEELVQRVVGLGRVRAEVSAELDFDRITENSEIFDPDTQVARSTQSVTETNSSNEQDREDNVSVRNNLPEAGAQGGQQGRAAQSSAERTEETVNFEISRTIRNRVREGGAVRKMSVAVLVDGTYNTNEAGERVYQARAPEQMAQIDRLVKSAIGFDAQRGDTVEVVNMEFVPLKPMEIEDGSLLFGMSKEEFLQLAEIIVLAVVGLLVVLLVVRPVLTRLFEAIPTSVATAPAMLGGQSEALAQLAGPGGQIPELIEPEDQEDDILDQMIDINQVEGRVRASSLKKIGEIVDKHPEEAVAIIRNWMYQEGTSG